MDPSNRVSPIRRFEGREKSKSELGFLGKKEHPRILGRGNGQALTRPAPFWGSLLAFASYHSLSPLRTSGSVSSIDSAAVQNA